MRKRVLSLLLVLAMVFSLFPVGVIAEEQTQEPTTTTDAFTFTFEQVNAHAAVTAGGTVDVNVYLSWSGAEAQSVNGFQLTFGANIAGGTVEQQNAVGEAAGMTLAENVIWWLDENTTDTTNCYAIGSEPTLVATAQLTVADVDLTGLTLETLLGASEGKVCIWGDTEFATDAQLVYKANAGCSHDGDTACEAAHANLGTQWVELTNENVDAVQSLAAGTYYYYLTGDVTDNSGLVFNGNSNTAAVKLVICLNSHTLKATAGKLFDLRNEGQSVTDFDCSENHGTL